MARARAVCRSAEQGSAAFRDAEAAYRTDDAADEHLRLLAARDRCLPDATAAAPAPSASIRDVRLTVEENEVAAMVGQGMRNREIAAALYISLRTAEMRLTAIYRKLGVSSRAHLVAKLYGGGTG